MKLKRIMAIVLCIAMVLSTMGTVAYAETTEADVWDGTVDTSWYDAANPKTEYTLTTAEQFAGLAHLVNGAQTYSPAMDNADTADFGYYCGKIAAPAANPACVDFEGVTIKLDADLDMRAVDTNGDYVKLPGNEYLTMMPIGYSIYTPFKGTFDGQGHTVKNVFQGMWDALGHPSDSYDQDIALGIFGNVENATIKNLVVDNISFNAEAVLGGVAGQVKGTSEFDTITIKNSTIASSGGWRAGGLIGDAEGELTIKNINIDETNTVAQVGGNYDTAVGGIVAKYSDGGSIAFKNCDVACKLDVYNDVVANHKTNVYRNCGMIIGAIGEENEIEIDGKLYPDFDAKGLTFNNVKATFGDWANYTYCWSGEVDKGCQRIEPGVSYGGIIVSNLNDYSVERIIFDSLFGAENAGDLSNVRQRVDIEVAEILGVTGIEAEEYQLLEGEGTQTDPYLINNIEDLRNLRDDVNIGNTYEGKYVELTADIDLTGEVWIPIGTSVYSKEPTDDDIKMFAGNFDGGNHTITGLTSEGYVPDSDETEDNEYSFGLFGCVYGSNISNIKLADVAIDGTARDNSDGNIVEGSGVAALVGYYMPVDGKTSIIENCHILSGTVKASNNMGGLIGFIDSNFRMPEVDITIKDCSNAADVTTDAREAGGVVGLIRSSRTDIEHISMRGNIIFENCENSGDITSLGGGNPSAGGILGRDGNEDSWAKLNMVFDSCKNTGKITVHANNETHAAGIVAGHYSNGAWFVIKDSSNSGEVVVVNPENAGDVYAGGLISYGGIVELLNSTSSRPVKLGTVDGNTFIGDVANILFIEEMYGYADTVNGCTYFLNGGDAPDERKYLTDDSGNYNFYPVETASKDGFEFGYWYDNPEFTGNVYDATTTIRNGGVKVFYAKWIGPVAKIGDVEYDSLEKAFAEAQEGETITLIADAVPVLKSQKAITKAAVVDLNGNKITLTEDDLYFGTTTFKNGDIVVAPVVKPSTAVFWMFKDQTLTFDNVKLTATGVTGTYLIGLDGNNSDLNLLNGSEIIVENDTALDLDIICVNASEGNDIVIDNSKVNVTNLDGRVFFRGNYTVSGNSDIDLEGITKAGFRIEKGQTLNIADTATVDIVGEPRDGGIHIVELPATYSKADTATVNATVNAPASDAKIKDTEYATLKEAFDAVKDGDVITLLSDVVIDENTRTHNSGEWYDGIYYIGDKSFTVDLNGFTITHDGSVNDYLLNFKNDGTKANEITIKNGVIDAGTDAFCAICTSSTSTQQITINLEDVTLINNKSNGSTAKIRGGAVLNVKKGTVINGLNSFLGIECVASTVNIYDGAEIYQNGTSSYLGGLVGACNGGVVNVYGGYGKSAKCGFVAMTSGGTINVSGGEWIANTDGTIGNNSNLYVLTSQNNSNESGYTGASIINVTGGTFFGGMDAWILNAGLNEVAELNITGGNFNADPVHYVESGYECKKVGNIIKVVKSATSATVKASAATSTVKAGDKVTVQVIAEGFDFTNGDWELRYDPTMFELDAAATTYYKDTTKGVEAQSVNSADENNLAGKVIAVGGSLKQGNEIPSGTVLATYTFTALPQSKDTVSGKFDIVNAHINTYDYAISQTNVPATTVDFDITITRENRNITGSLDVATPTYNGDFQKGNVFVVDDSVVGKDGAVITYSKEENGIYTTELPTFKEAGSYKIWVKVNVDGYTEYKAEHEYMVIGKKDIALSLEVAAGAAYNKVAVKPVITGVCDTEFNGTLTVSGVNGTYTKNDFIYMGNGLAIAKEAKPMDVNAGNNTITITYTAADKDNYAGASETTNVDADKAFATQTIVDDLNKAADAAVTYTYNGTEHTAQDKIITPDGWDVVVTRISDGEINPSVTNVADKEFVEIRFTHDNYNDVVISRVLQVEPLDLTITVPDFEKGAGEADDFTTKSVTYTSNNFVSSAEFATIDDLVATAGLNASIVRKTLGEDDGIYDLTVTYTPNDNYSIVIVDGDLTIGMPSDTKIEVVNNTLNGNGNSSADYVAGYKLVLVYTNTATARYTYDDKEMFDLSNAGYEYFDNTKSIADQTDDNYKYVYGIIVKAEGTAEDAYYADKVDFIGTNKYKPEKIVYDADINYDDKFSPNDISAANGVLNVEHELDAFFMYYFLKADYDRTENGEYKSDKMVKLFDVQEVQKFINTKTTIQ